MKEVTFSRKELYDLVWSTPISKLAKEYNVYDTALRKASIALGIPLPLAGHWSRVNAGKEVLPKPLPDHYKGEDTVNLPLRLDGQNNEESELSPLQILKHEIENNPLLDLSVKETLIDPDPLVKEAKKSFQDRNEFEREDSLSMTGRNVLDIKVTPKFINRALCIMDTFITAMRKLGWNFENQDKESFIVIEGSRMKLTFREIQKREIDKNSQWNRTIDVPTGKLALKLDRYGQSIVAKDGKFSVEQQLTDIIAKLELLKPVFKAERLEQEQWRAQYKEDERNRNELINRRKVELDSFKQILEDSRRWKETVLLREYIDHVEEEAKSKGRLTDDIKEWLDWAKRKADWFDPLLEVEDEWLKEVDPNSLLAHHKDQPKTQSYDSGSSALGASQKYWPGMPWYLRE